VSAGVHGGREMVFEKIKEIIANKIQVDEDKITPDTSLMKDLEADSLDAVEIIMGIEEEFGIDIPDSAAEGFKNVGDIAKFVESKI
jgi:acyl carrier protein